MKVKHLIYSFVFLLCFASFTSFVSADTQDSPENASTQTDNAPYDMIKSDGTVVKFSEYSKSLTQKDYDEISNGILGNGKEITPGAPFHLKPLNELGFSKVKDTPNEVVFGTDTRKKVSDTSKKPNRSISYISTTFSNGNFVCTGTVIGKDTVLTNAHCVYDKKTKKYLKSGYIIPALNDSHYRYGYYKIASYSVPSGYIKSGGSPQYDFAVIKVSTNGGLHIGNVVGSLGVKQVNSIKGTGIKIYGYPGDKAQKTKKVSQWGASGSIKKENSFLAFYDVDTYGGQSGSAMLNSSNQIIGVHNGGYDLNSNKVIDVNGGPKMTKPMYNFVTYAR
ncbi:glutamyl endopeptidase [Bacillus cereus]|uniref:trypsin-like serine peptidase n=1 Tax=Bacillus cereus TaxID=1396 RepID=UPI000BF3243B|nr:trypsin-like serine protease [Bacillus cereus]PFA24755.1 glutamyl endopeptidase [Bacillus cereus]PGZ18756.1 glutamyl endopeptidase [Bacillus cereus]